MGDSVLYDAAGVLSQYGFASNAMVCRTMAQGIDWLIAHREGLPALVVVALGTNGSVTDGQIEELLQILGPDRLLAMVTPHHGNYAYVPGLIRAAAGQHAGRIVILDWDRLSAAHPEWFAPDGIHLGGAAGISAFANLVGSALLASPTHLPPAATEPVPSPPLARPVRPVRAATPKHVAPRHAVSAPARRHHPDSRHSTIPHPIWRLVVASLSKLAIALASG